MAYMQATEVTPQSLEWYVNTIEPGVLNLVIKMNCLPFAKTFWSCHGHPMAGFCATRHAGFRFETNDEDQRTEAFIAGFENLLENSPFTKRLRYPGAYIIDSNPISYPQYRGLSFQEQLIALRVERAKIYEPFHQSFDRYIDYWLESCSLNDKVLEFLSLASRIPVTSEIVLPYKADLIET